MQAWPSSLPCQPLANSLSFRPETNKTEFQPDVGSPMRRQRYTGFRVLYQAEMQMTAEERDECFRFYTVDCAGGVFNFTMKDWRTGLIGEFSWVNEPAFQRIGGNIWMVSLSIALEPS